MSGLRMRRADEVDAEILGAFLEQSFGPAKGEFLRCHGTWWHRGVENRWVLTDGDRIAGYCGVIPGHCLVAGEARSALWWMDLVIAPEYRGQGLQTRFDDLVRERGGLLLGFPNELAAKIHRHHGWGVREDLRTLLLPLDPPRMAAIRRAHGASGRALRLAAVASRPAMALWRWHLRRYQPSAARELASPDWQRLATVAGRLEPGLVTALRDAESLRWRYAEGPREHVVYVSDDEETPKLALIARRLASGAERWLDLFGDLSDRESLADLVRFAARRSAEDGLTQITILSADRTLTSALVRLGFVPSAKARFCWYDDDRETMDAMARASHHWCLGDSDNDEPESPVS